MCWGGTPPPVGEEAHSPRCVSELEMLPLWRNKVLSCRETAGGSSIDKEVPAFHRLSHLYAIASAICSKIAIHVQISLLCTTFHKFSILSLKLYSAASK